jgi:ATP-binding protein involved in chromosome partitioning
MSDPRLAVIDRRLASVRQIIAVTGGKGGIGKTLVSSTLALALSASGRRAGLLDLDFTGPCAHLVLGGRRAFPQEDRGILPQLVALASGEVEFMSVACFTGDDPAPLRGADLTNALIELLAITRWGELDTLVIDMPPGLGDMALDAVQILPRAEYVVVATSAQLVTQTVRRTLALLQRLDRTVSGVIENMVQASTGASIVSPTVATLAAQHSVAILGALPADPDIELALGQPTQLLATRFGMAVRSVVPQL